MSAFPYKRIVIIGVTSSGKSTLAEKIAKRFDLDFIELDALHWEPNWQEAPLETFRERVHAATQVERWCVAGNYSVVRDLVWSRAQALIWLNYPFWLVLRQLVSRTYRRWRTKELLWETNHDLFWRHFKLWSKDSLIHWLFKTYWRRKRETPQLVALPEYQHLELIRFDHPQEADRWLESLS